jgi:hypothetical protein
VTLTNIFMPADARKQYTLYITADSANTTIPVVFYPAELDPEVIFDMMDQLDSIIHEYGAVNPESLAAYLAWATVMAEKINDLQGEINNLSATLTNQQALGEIAMAAEAIGNAKELCSLLMEKIRTRNEIQLTIEDLEVNAQGVWDNYYSALLFKETAVAREAGADAFANSLLTEARYIYVSALSEYGGLTTPPKGNPGDIGSTANILALIVAIAIGAGIFILVWMLIDRFVPMPRSKGKKAGLKKLARFIIPIAVGGILAGVVVVYAYMILGGLFTGLESWIGGF